MQGSFPFAAVQCVLVLFAFSYSLLCHIENIFNT